MQQLTVSSWLGAFVRQSRNFWHSFTFCWGARRRENNLNQSVKTPATLAVKTWSIWIILFKCYWECAFLLYTEPEEDHTLKHVGPVMKLFFILQVLHKFWHPQPLSCSQQRIQEVTDSGQEVVANSHLITVMSVTFKFICLWMWRRATHYRLWQTAEERLKPVYH